jgi:hypothetical protein
MRFAAVVVFLIFTALVPIAVFRCVDALDAPPVEIGLDVAKRLETNLAKLRDSEQTTDTWDVAYLGDSMLIGNRPGRRVPDQLQGAVDRIGGTTPIRVHSFAERGTGPFDFYFIADRLADAQPDQVIIPFNLAALSESWRAAFARPRLSGLLPPSRLGEALALPLEPIGLTADRLLSSVAVVWAGAEGPWRNLVARQAQLGPAHRQVAALVATGLGSDAEQRFALAAFRYPETLRRLPGGRRSNQNGIAHRYGRALGGVGPDFPALQLLGAAIRVLSERGIQVLVYANPTNVRHIEAQGSANPKGLARTLASTEAVAEREGARFLDLHDLLPDAGFRDLAGHLQANERIDGPALLAERIAPIVVESAVQARRD